MKKYIYLEIDKCKDCLYAVYYPVTGKYGCYKISVFNEKTKFNVNKFVDPETVDEECPLKDDPTKNEKLYQKFNEIINSIDDII